MTRRRPYMALGGLAALCLALALALRPDGGLLAGLLAFPFAPLGGLLRWMSLSGGAGNALAVALYVLAGLVPAGYLCLRLIHRRARAEDALLAVLSGLAFLLLYWGVNPGLMPLSMGAVGLAFGGSVFWSAAAGYLVLRLLRGCMAADERSLRRYARTLGWALAALCVFGAAGMAPMALLGDVRRVLAGNAGSEYLLGPTWAVLALRCAVSAAGYGLDLLAVLAGLDLLDAWEAGPWSQEAADAAAKLSRRCVRALAFTAVAGTALALVQLLCAGRLHAAAVRVNVPLVSMGLVLMALLLARYIRAGKALKDDNDLFI